MDLLPDLTGKETFEILRDVLSLGMAALGACLAWLAIKMGREQAAISHVQHTATLQLHKSECRGRVEVLTLEGHMATVHFRNDAPFVLRKVEWAVHLFQEPAAELAVHPMTGSRPLEPVIHDPSDQFGPRRLLGHRASYTGTEIKDVPARDVMPLALVDGWGSMMYAWSATATYDFGEVHTQDLTPQSTITAPT